MNRMIDDEDRSSSSESGKPGVSNLLSKTPLVLNPALDQLAQQRESSAHTKDDPKKMYSSSSSRSATPEQGVLNNSADQLKKSDHGDFNDAEIQRKMNQVITQSQSRPITPQKPTTATSHHDGKLTGTENVNSALTTPKNGKSNSGGSATQQRQNSFSHEPTSSDDMTLDDELFHSKTSHEDRPSSNRSKKDGLDETRRFGVASPKPTAPDDPTQPVSSRPNSRSSKDDRRSPSINPTASASRPASAVKADPKPPSRPTSARKSPLNENAQHPLDHQKRDPPTNDLRLQLIKLGEQLHIPEKLADNEQLSSPPPSPGGTKQLVSTNPLLSHDTTVKNDQDRSRPSSSDNRTNSNTGVESKPNSPAAEPAPLKSRPGSQTSQQQRSKLADQKPASPKGNKGSEQPTPHEPKKDAHEQRPASRQSLLGQEDEKSSSKVASRKNSSTSQAKVLSRRASQQPTDANQNKKSNSSRRASFAQETLSSHRASDVREKPATEKEGHVPSSTKQPSPRVPSQQARKSPNAEIQPTPVQAASTTDQHPPAADVHHRSPNVSKSPAARDLPSPRDDQERPKSPNVQQISERNPSSTSKKSKPANGQKKQEQREPLLRSTSAESFNHIPIVDDKSIDSYSGNTTEGDRQKKRPVRSKKKDMETNTESSMDEKPQNRGRAQVGSQQQGSTLLQKAGKPEKAISNQLPHRRGLTKEASSELGKPTKKRSGKQPTETDEEPVNVNVTVLVKNYAGTDDDETPSTRDTQGKRKEIEPKAQRLPKPSAEFERTALSDTEQIITEKQKKRRRPKRISRTTQTHERIFRMMAFEEHEELRPTEQTEKCIQTRRSQLRPPTKSPRKQPPIYLSTEAFKMEEILPNQFPHAQRNVTKTSVVARSTSPHGGKLLILRPTLPLHHTNAVNVQRICLQYAIDLIPNNAQKQSDQPSHFPAIRASSSSSPTSTTAPAVPPTQNHRFSTKDKSNTARNPVRPYQQRRNDGAV